MALLTARGALCQAAATQGFRGRLAVRRCTRRFAAPPSGGSGGDAAAATTAAPPAAAAQSLAGAVPPAPGAVVDASWPFYSQFPLDRRAEWRRDSKRLDALFDQADARLVPIYRDRVLVTKSASASSAHPASVSPPAPAPPLLQPLLLIPASAHAALVTASPARVFLGLDASGAPYFAAAAPDAAAADALAAAHPGAEWRSARAAGPDLAAGDASLLAVASSLLVWHRENAFSASTGAPAAPSAGGHSRKCTASGASTYPRIDPAVIVLVTSRDGQLALLGRKPEWPQDRYSTLAGFLEVGEPLEAAVAREVEEESDVAVDTASVSYSASQPWPFPRSLMVGFNARAAPAAQVAARRAAAAAAATPGYSVAVSSSSSGGGGSNGAGCASSGRSGSSAGASTSTSTTTGGGGYNPIAASQRHWWQPAPPVGGAPAAGFDLLPSLGRRAALDVGLFREEAEEALRPLQELQWPSAAVDELADVRWFHRDWLRAVLRSPYGAASVMGAGSFNIPGPYSLAYKLITDWAGAVPVAGGGGGSGQQQQEAQLGQAAAAAGDAGSVPGAWAGDAVPQVLISGSGTFKYVLMRLWDPAAEEATSRSSSGGGGGAPASKLLVWGDVRAPYHNDVLQKARALASRLGLKATPLGGGRMRHDPQARTIDIYGYSAAFGPAPHEVAAALVHRWFPLYERDAIMVSYEGY